MGAQLCAVLGRSRIGCDCEGWLRSVIPKNDVESLGFILKLYFVVFRIAATISILRVKCDFTKFDSFGANFLVSVYLNAKPFFIFRLPTLGPKSLWKSKGNMFPGRMLLI